MNPNDPLIRPLAPADSVAELTALLHQAYGELASKGMRFLASHQNEAKTRERIGGGECYVAIQQGQIVGTILWRPPRLPGIGSAAKSWYDRAGVASFHQFAVHPAFQKRGVGGRLLALVEARTAETGCRELALDTAEPAASLIGFYSRRGYRFIEFVQWSVTNYRSVILSKSI
ncbi:MAG TPA: GNAT family N-acetyltransferase [Phycisphaerae bacterium]